MSTARTRDRAALRRASVAGPRGIAAGLTALLVAVVAAVVPAAGATPSSPTAMPRAAACGSGSDGVTVVVDFGTLPGGVQIRCVTEPVSSGFDALRKAGFTPAGTQRFPGLLCRIDGKPADEPCVNAPPPDRYWAYWTATEPGGKWTYSDLGAGNRTPPPGSVEGWAFSDGCTRAPQASPCSAPTTTTRPRATTTTTSAGSGGSADGPGGGSSPSTTVAVVGPGGSSPTTTQSEPGQTATTHEPDGGAAPEPGEEGDEPDVGGEQAAAVASDGDEDDRGSPLGAVVGLVVAAGLGVAAIRSARRRRGVEEEPA